MSISIHIKKVHEEEFIFPCLFDDVTVMLEPPGIRSILLLLPSEASETEKVRSRSSMLP
jgi:hypothetical protein